MTDEEHTSAILSAAKALNEAIKAAARDGLSVEVDSERSYEWEGVMHKPQDVYLAKVRVTRRYAERVP